MRVILLGPQGAGKGTQAQRLSDRVGATHISTGDIVRAEIKSGSELGKKVQDYNDRGELVPDEIIVEMAKPGYSTASPATRPRRKPWMRRWKRSGRTSTP